MERILITGMGIVSAIGNNVEETLLSLRKNYSGIKPLRYLNTSHTEFPVGEVKMSNEEMTCLLELDSNKVSTRTSLMGIMAVKEALKMAKISNNEKCRIALISGTTVGGMDKSELYYLDFIENDTKNKYISAHDCGACTEMIADYFGIFSQVDTISTACSSAANAILLGAELLKNGKADIVVAGGSECITKFHLNGFNTLMILDKEICRPFDASRAGLNLGEGAAYLIMETDKHFEKRASSLDMDEFMEIVELAGAANTCDAYHQTASSPDGEGAFLAMQQALKNAGLQPKDVDYIKAHGTGTPNNDLSEGNAIMRLFGEHIPLVSSIKSSIGHTTSASGSIESVILILALQHEFVPANLNFSTAMPELNFTPYCITDKATVKIKLNNILSNSFGFGGNDTSLVFSRKSITKKRV